MAYLLSRGRSAIMSALNCEGLDKLYSQFVITIKFKHRFGLARPFARLNTYYAYGWLIIHQKLKESQINLFSENDE